MKADRHTSSDEAEGELFRLLVENVQAKPASLN